MKLNVINPLQDSRWDAFVEKHPLGCVFHHSTWKEVLDTTFPHLESMYFIVEDSDSTIVAGAPFFFIKSWLTGRRLISLPFSIYCDPLVYSPTAFKVLVKGLSEKREERKASFIEIRTRFSENLFKRTHFKKSHFYKNHTLPLEPDLETIRKSFHRSCVRQHIHRAEQSNLSVTEASSEADVQIFYQLICMTRKKFGVPPHPYSFYKNMWEIMYPRNMMSILIARRDDQPVCSLLFLKYKQRVHAEYMGTNDAFIRYSPNILLFWKAIEKAKNEGYKFFEFGSSSREDHSLIAFKSRWGTTEEDLSYMYLPDVGGISAGFGDSIPYKILTALGKKMPDRLFIKTGNFLYNHLGG